MTTGEADRKWSLRPQQAHSVPTGTTLEAGFRVYMSGQDMQTEKLSQGDRITLRSESTGVEGVAIVWRATDNVGGKINPVIRISEWLRGFYSFELKDKYFIKKSSVQFQRIETITVIDVTLESNSEQTPPCTPRQLEYWAGVALGKCPIITILRIF
jgi:hypothetical protein